MPRVKKYSKPLRRVTWLITLTCHHESSFCNPVPEPGDTIWCVRCSAETKVSGVISQFGLRCLMCSFAREYGRAKLSAERAAARHRRNYGYSHVVEMFDGLKLIYTFGANKRQLVIPMIDGKPPF